MQHTCTCFLISTCSTFQKVVQTLFVVLPYMASSSRRKGKGMRVTAVELTDLADGDSKEEQDTATAVDNICYEKVPSKLNILHQPTIRYHMSL